MPRYFRQTASLTRTLHLLLKYLTCHVCIRFNKPLKQTYSLTRQRFTRVFCTCRAAWAAMHYPASQIYALPISLQQTYQVSGPAIHISVSLEMTKRRGWDEPSLIQLINKLTDYHILRNSLSLLFHLRLSDTNRIVRIQLFVLNGTELCFIL